MILDLKQAEINRLNIINKHIANGVIVESANNLYIGEGVVIGKGTVIHDNNHIDGNTVIGSDALIGRGNEITNSRIGSGCQVRSSVIANSEIGANTTVGVYAHIHTHTVIGKGCRVGNFVEIKNSRIGNGNKMAHLAYIGDVDMANYCNVGCGAIFVNYDGKNKHRSSVGNSVFIGSNSNVVAPVILEDNAYIAAGTTVTQSLPSNCMCIGRKRETVKENCSRYVKNMTKKYFGTDGIRGVYGDKITDELAYLCGNYLGYSSDYGKVVVGRDTRVSGAALSEAIIRGCTEAGTDVIDLGIVPTPIVAYVTQLIGANYGVVISASHNPPEFNGIKIFNYNGRKLSAIEEIEIEQHIDNNTPIIRSVKGVRDGDTTEVSDYIKAISEYIGPLNGMKISIDCANGASSVDASKILEGLGIDVISYNIGITGVDINAECGATCPKTLAERVVADGADMGLCLDGDADRIIAVDEKGDIVDGDSMLLIIARYLSARDELKNNTVAATVHSNMALTKQLNKLGIKVEITDVGDHNVVRAMAESGLVLGGEQSGHIILGNFAMTGDGILAGLLLAKIVKSSGKTLSQLNDLIKFPQTNYNYRTDNAKNIVATLKNTVDAFNAQLVGVGRVMLRASGTEPLLRIMTEHESLDESHRIADELLGLAKQTDKEL